MALTLYEKEVGPKPEKVCHFGFLKHVLFKRKKFGIINKEKHLKGILTLLTILGHCPAHY